MSLSMKKREGNGTTECTLCGDECESVIHVLWECPAYKDMANPYNYTRTTIRVIIGKLRFKLRTLLGEASKL